MNLNIVIATGSRAEYGLLRNLIKLVDSSKEFNLVLLITGSHLSKKFGLTYKEIEKDNISTIKKINLELKGDQPINISDSTALGIKGFAKAYREICPDLIILLGDRYEMLSAVIPALYENIPIAHIHGGETTEGLIDEAIRHSITKFSNYHFVASEIYRKRVIQLGEHPDRVFNVGGMGIDALESLELKTREELEQELKIKFLSKSLIVTFHPVTLEKSSSKKFVTELINSLKKLKNTTLIITLPNADIDSQQIISSWELFAKNRDNTYLFSSLGQLNYFSLLKHVDGIIGNSSSGLLEVPYFKKGTINIGERQKGRLKANTVIDCEPIQNEISKAINHLYSDYFKAELKNVMCPYGEPGASRKILKIIKNLDLKKNIQKKFYDL